MHQTLRTESRASHAVCAFAVLVLAAAAFAAQVDPPAVEWEQTWLAGTAVGSNVIIQTPDGSYIATGEISRGGWRISDLCLVKGDAGGNLQWSTTYHAGETNLPMSLCLSDDGGYVVAPWTWDAEGEYTRRLLKFDKDGGLLWDREYGHEHELWSDMARTLDGGYVLTAVCSGVGQPGTLMATDGDGKLLWERHFMESAGAYDNQSWGVAATAEGEYMVTGTTNIPDPEREWANCPYLAKFGRDGSFIWEKIISIEPRLYNEGARRVRQDRAGGFVVGGTLLARMDAQGNTLWAKDVAVPDLCDWTCSAYWIEQTSDGGYIMVGNDPYKGTNEAPGWIAKYDKNGERMWFMAPPLSSIVCTCVRQTSDGGYIVYGQTDGLWLMKLAPDSPPAASFMRGRTDSDDVLNLADAICLLGYLFGPADEPCKQTIAQCLDAADANDSGAVDIADAIATLSHLFAQAGPLKPPFDACGIDPTSDELDCASYPPCAQ